MNGDGYSIVADIRATTSSSFLNKKMKTKDPVNQHLVDDYQTHGLSQFGLMASSVWRDDPRRLMFSLSRYKFVAKMLHGLRDVAEIGCGDGFGSRIVRQEVENLMITDFDPLYIEQFSNLSDNKWPIDAQVHDILSGPLDRCFQAIYCLDVLEHILPDQEALAMKNICDSLVEDGIGIFGMPSIESQAYASRESREGHVNCKTGNAFEKDLRNYFKFVFIFSMNDEVVHTGYQPMAHYLIGLCCGVKSKQI